MIHIRVKITCDACGLVMFPLHHQDGDREIQDIAAVEENAIGHSTLAEEAARLARHAVWSCVRLGAHLTCGRIVCSGCRRLQVAS